MNYGASLKLLKFYDVLARVCDPHYAIITGFMVQWNIFEYSSE